jgi:hypothetical protein
MRFNILNTRCSCQRRRAVTDPGPDSRAAQIGDAGQIIGKRGRFRQRIAGRVVKQSGAQTGARQGCIRCWPETLEFGIQHNWQHATFFPDHFAHTPAPCQHIAFDITA